MLTESPTNDIAPVQSRFVVSECVNINRVVSFVLCHENENQLIRRPSFHQQQLPDSATLYCLVCCGEEYFLLKLLRSLLITGVHLRGERPLTCRELLPSISTALLFPSQICVGVAWRLLVLAALWTVYRWDQQCGWHAPLTMQCNCPCVIGCT